MPIDTDYFHFRLLRAKLAWHVNLRIDIICAVAVLVQSQRKDLQNEGLNLIKIISSIVICLSNNTESLLKNPKHDKHSCSLNV